MSAHQHVGPALRQHHLLQGRGRPRKQTAATQPTGEHALKTMSTLEWAPSMWPIVPLPIYIPACLLDILNTVLVPASHHDPELQSSRQLAPQSNSHMATGVSRPFPNTFLIHSAVLKAHTVLSRSMIQDPLRAGKLSGWLAPYPSRAELLGLADA